MMTVTDIVCCDQAFYSEQEADTIQKISFQMQNLSRYFKERDEIVEAFFLCLLAKQHLVMIGPPGTGKSYLIESFNEGFQNMKLFQWQVTKFSTPEELFGPYSLTELKKGHYARITENKLPTADIAYIDEVFNANSSILNALNSSMNERIHENHEIPLDSLFGATNFIPEEHILVAFFDRFLFRFVVGEISDASAFQAMLAQGDFEEDVDSMIPKAELKLLQEKVKEIDSSLIIPLMTKLREALKAESIEPSSRRFRWAIQVLQAKALVEGRKEIIEEDLFILKNIMWTDKKEIPIVEQIIARTINPAIAEIRELLQQAKDIEKHVKSADPKNPEELAQILEALEKLKSLSNDIDDILQKKTLSPKVRKVAEKIMKQVRTTGKKIQDTKLNFAF